MVSGAVAGGVLGLGVQLYANAVRKLPLSRNPWEHVLFMGIGAYLGNAVVEWEARATEELEQMLAQRAEANKGIRFRERHTPVRVPHGNED